jgi:hypothetical protein
MQLWKALCRLVRESGTRCHRHVIGAWAGDPLVRTFGVVRQERARASLDVGYRPYAYRSISGNVVADFPGSVGDVGQGAWRATTARRARRSRQIAKVITFAPLITDPSPDEDF